MAKTAEGSTRACVASQPADRCKGQAAGWLETGLIFVAGLLLFLVGVDNRELIQLECRTGLFVKEMWENGIGWFPTVYGKPYPDYPVTHPALIYAVSGLFGQLSARAAVLPTAAAAAISLALTYRVGLIASRLLALWAVLFELGTYGFFSTARSVSLDHLTAAITAGCFLAAYRWLVGGRNLHFLVPLLCVAGFICRGPIGFLLPAGVAVACCLVERRLRALLLLSPVLTALFAACGLGLMAVAEQVGGRTFAWEVWDMQAGSRLAGIHAKVFYYYLIHGFTTYAISFPLALLVLIRLRKPLLSTSGDAKLRLLRALAASFLVLFLGLHIPAAKMSRYLLPLVPIASLIAAFLMVGAESEPLARGRVWLIKALRLLPALGIGAAGLLFAIWPRVPIDARPSWWWLWAGLLAIGGLSFKLVPRIISCATREYLIGALGFAVVAVIHVAVAEPVKESLETARPFVTKLETTRSDMEQLVFYRIGPDQEDIRYILNASRPIQPQFVRTATGLLQVPQNAWVITRESDFTTLPGEVRKRAAIQFRGRLGHRECVVFRLGGR